MYMKNERVHAESSCEYVCMRSGRLWTVVGHISYIIHIILFFHNIHFSNANGSYPFYVDNFLFSLSDKNVYTRNTADVLCIAISVLVCTQRYPIIGLCVPYVLMSVLNDVRFVFPHLFVRRLMSIYVICVLMYMEVSNTSWLYKYHGGCSIWGRNLTSGL